MLKISRPRVEYLVRPLAVSESHPRFSWELQSDRRNVVQHSYRLHVRSADKHWDSGIVESSQSMGIEYTGPQLPSGEQVTWSLEVVANNGESASIDEYFETAPDGASWGEAEWITLRRPQYQHDDYRPTPYLRTTIDGSAVTRARLHITAGGLMQTWVNGRRIDASSLTPGWTDYSKRVPFHTYDISEFFVGGPVTIGSVVADGWYAGGVGPFHKRNFWGKHPALKAIIVIERADGSTELHSSGPHWEASFGPIQAADLLQGEVIDARKAIGDWSSGEGEWGTAATVDGPAGKLVPALIPGAAPIATLEPVAITEPSPGTVVVDFGQNHAGHVRLSIEGPAGLIVRVRHAERLRPDGQIYTDNLRGARATDTFILSGGRDTFEPSFTYHGYQYCELTGLVDGVEWSISAIAISSIPEMTGSLITGNSLVNQLQQNTQWSMFSNFVEVPTDCPSRDERTGWTGDAQIFAPTALLNADLASFYTKWLGDIDDTRMANGALPDIAPAVVMDWAREGSSGYAEAGIIVPWVLYEKCGDIRILERFYDAAAAWVAYVKERSPDLIWRENRNTDYGDWLAPEPTDKALTATAYFARSAQLVSWYAQALGRSEDAIAYGALHQEIAAAFRREFVDRDGTMPDGTQTAYVLALAFDLLEPAQRAAAAAALASNVEDRGHITTGFLAVAQIMPLLVDIGRTDLAYSLLLNTEYPSWGHSIAHGATTIWERWDGWRPETGFQDPLMNSFNHFAVGCVGEWLFERMAGLRSTEAGFGHVLVQPAIDPRIGFAEAKSHTIRGSVETGWRLDGDRLELRVSLPANVTGTVVIPADSVEEAGLPLEQVPGIEVSSTDDGGVEVLLGSGDYSFVGRLLKSSVSA